MGDVIDLLAFVKERERTREERWHVANGVDIAKPRPPIPYVCRDLAIAPGVTIFGGAGFGGKTTSLQALMLAIASGQKAWGAFDVTQGRVTHLDFEQGPDLTFLKYQRMARAMKIDLGGLGDTLSCSSLPDTSLSDSPQSADELCWLLEGRALGIVDAFRGAFPDAQENDSGVRKYLDMAQRVTQKTGCAIVMIAHSRKMSDDKDVRSSLRGSGALFDAAQTVWMIDGAKGKPSRCTNTKERLRGKIRDAFGLRIEDVPGVTDDNMRDDEWGLSVNYVSGPEMQAAYAHDAESDDNLVASNVGRIDTLGNRVGDIVAANLDGISIHAIKAALFGTPGALLNGAISLLVQGGSIRQEGPTSNAVFFPVHSREPGVD
jgi:hypothetical protein